MNRSELFMMAVQNLWTRKSRTAFNIFGIVISCAMLLLVFAGTRGAREGLLNLFSQSDFARQFAITAGRDKSALPKNPKASPIEPGAGISKDRRERIGEKLDKAWETRNLPLVRMTLEKLETLRETSKIASVMPQQSMRIQLSFEDQRLSANAACFSTETSGLEKRIIAGEPPQADSSRGKVWIDEYRAWRLGYKTDEQLNELIGKTVKLQASVAAPKLSPKMQRLARLFGVKGAPETQQIADTFRKLFDDVDQTSLNEIEIAAVQTVARRLGLDSALPTEEPNAEKNQLAVREFEIAGIVKPPDQSATTLFQVTRANRGTDLLIDWRDYHAIEKATNSNRIYYYTLGAVSDASELKEAITEVEAAGFTTRSALEVLEKADIELGKVRLIVAAIALVILLIASVGIMNTMIIAVMERTPEFGIMKAVGAKDSDIRQLMLIESALTGVLGAAVSFGVARLLDSVISRFARRYIETRVRQDFDFDVFVYSIGDGLLVAVIAVVICTLASLLPSHRAAKLNPVEAMK